MIWLLIGLILFLGMHSVRMVLPGVREVFWQAWGENAWKGIYTVISIIGLVLIVWGLGWRALKAPFFMFRHLGVVMQIFF